MCAKYIARGSLWEALETLHAARTRLWRLWAAARRVADPQFGLTAVLDDADPSPPPGIEQTHAALDRRALARAALTCSEQIEALWPKATAAVGGSALPVPPVAIATREKLAALIRSLPGE